MIRLITFTICLQLAYSIPAQEGPSKTQVTEPQVQEAIESFAVNFGKQLKDSSKAEQDSLYSPLSVYTALLLLHSGASGSTKDEISSALKIPSSPSSESQFYQNFNSILGKLVNSTLVNVEVANGVFVQNKFPLNDQYTQRVKSLLDGQISNVNFAESKTVELINKWISEKTKGRIPDLFKDKFDPDTVVLLASALYFSGNWEHEFHEQNTQLGKFKSGNKEVYVHYLNAQNLIPYYNNTALNSQIIGIPYEGNQFVFFIVLPNEDNSLEKVLNSLKPGDLKSIIQQTKDQRTVAYKMPKIKFNFGKNLNEQLQKLGIKVAFKTADLSALTPSKEQIKVSEVTHAAEMEVNEKGTVASAVTTVQITTESLFIDPRPVVPFKVDRPFLFFIGHQQTNTILFYGTVYTPTA